MSEFYSTFKSSRYDPGTTTSYKDGSDALANKGMIIQFTHVPTGTVVNFKAFIEAFAETYKPSWKGEVVFGRMDPIYLFQHTTRTLNLAFKVPAGTEGEGYENLGKLQKLIQCLYPVYTNPAQAQTIVHAPLLRLKIMNLVRDAGSVTMTTTSPEAIYRSYSQEGPGILGTISNVSINHNVETEGVIEKGGGSVITAILPKNIGINLDFTPIHEHPVGWSEDDEFGKFNDENGENFPYGAPLYTPPPSNSERIQQAEEAAASPPPTSGSADDEELPIDPPGGDPPPEQGSEDIEDDDDKPGLWARITQRDGDEDEEKERFWESWEWPDVSINWPEISWQWPSWGRNSGEGPDEWEYLQTELDEDIADLERDVPAEDGSDFIPFANPSEAQARENRVYDAEGNYLGIGILMSDLGSGSELLADEVDPSTLSEDEWMEWLSGTGTYGGAGFLSDDELREEYNSIEAEFSEYPPSGYADYWDWYEDRTGGDEDEW